MMMIFILLGGLMLASSCATGRKTQITNSVTRDGSAIDRAVVVQSVKEEYTWVYGRYPNSRVVKQALISQGKKHYDLLTVAMPDGERTEFYFDINSFFGKW